MKSYDRYNKAAEESDKVFTENHDEDLNPILMSVSSSHRELWGSIDRGCDPLYLPAAAAQMCSQPSEHAKTSSFSYRTLS